MQNKLMVLGFILMFTQISCSSSVIFRSTPPKCSITMRDSKSNEDKVIGETPLEMDLSKLSEMVNTGPVMLRISKRGYQPREYIIPNLFNTNLTVDAFLYPSISDYRKTNQVIAQLFTVHKLIQKKRFTKAIKIVNEIVAENPNIATAYEMYGTIYFLQKDYVKSYDNWIKVIELEPENVEAQKMVELIEKAKKKLAL